MVVSIIEQTQDGDALSHRFNGHFPGGPGLAGTGMSPFWILLELGMIEVVVTAAATGRPVKS